ncbi:MAG: beta-N-acetylhexosaminidase [Tissierellia bacterium]|nr:beta-N-acetylhexosaminidase [Tissierellia bacterium]
MIKKPYLIILLVIVLLLTACNRAKMDVGEEDNFNKKNLKEDTPLKETNETQDIDEIQELLDNMTLEEKIGQLFIFGINGTKINQNTIELIEKNHIGGFILFRENIESGEQTLELLNDLKEKNKNNPLPLFLAIDEEGGRVSRLPREFPKMPAAKKIGDINNKDISFQYGEILGMRIKSLGFNMDFAPVMDINSNPKNPVIGDRAFGSTVDIVVDNSIETMKGINSKNIIPVIKHFPGHGDTIVDSHIDVPIINKSLEELEKLELIPFVKAIENDVDSIMIGHILFSELDDTNPATLSNTIINHILREKLKFKGVIISDDLNMGAIARNYDIKEAVIKYFKAGGDIALICHSEEEEYEIFNMIKDEIKNGKIKEEEIDEKVYRIINLKRKYNIEDNTIQNFNMEKLNGETEKFLKKLKDF